MKGAAPHRGWASALLIFLAVALLGGCADAGYYLQSISGHLELLNRARPISDVINDPTTSPALRDRLALVEQMRAFAVSELDLPDNASYHRYAAIDRRAVVWNVVAAPPDSLQLKTWCFPVAGCVGYRGYYDEAKAQALAGQIETQDFEVAVQPIPAYSTLGWSNWFGGDPLVSTFINYPEGELARLIFHELAHQRVYAKDDTTFNESFASTVERLGAARWLQQHGSPAARAEYAALDVKRKAFLQLNLAARRELEQIYARKSAGALDEPSLLAMKKEAMQRFRSNYHALRAGWLAQEPALDARRFAGYDQRVAQANNAWFGTVAAYDAQVPQFLALFEASGQDFGRFYDAALQLAALPKADRNRRLEQGVQGAAAAR